MRGRGEAPPPDLNALKSLTGLTVPDDNSKESMSNNNIVNGQVVKLKMHVLQLLNVKVTLF